MAKGLPSAETCYVNPRPSEVGLRADRGCTNVFFLILFMLFWALMGYVAFVAYTHGDLDRLRYGVDYLGNVCGKGSPVVDFHGSNVTRWADRRYLWYPVTFTASEGFIIQRALRLGVCVDRCPMRADVRVVPYTDPNSTTSFPPYRVLFDSTLRMNRCIPDLGNFDCDALPEAWEERCRGSRNGTSVGITTVYGMLEEGFNELATNWWIILVCALIAIVISFIWMFCLRRLVKPMVVISLLLVLIAGILVGYFLFLKSKRIKETHPESDTHKWYFYGAIAMAVVVLLYLCVVAFLWRDIMLACDIIEEASKIPVRMPTIMLIPVVLVFFIIPFAIFGLFTAAHIYTSAKSITHAVPYPVVDYDTNNTAVGNFTVEMREYTFENWRVYAHLYNLFMFLWTFGFIHAIGYMMVAFCGIFWYWSAPGDAKAPEGGACKAAGLTLGNHLGTLALGSMIIAIIQLIRVVMRLMENRLEQISQKADIVRVLVRCAECCLACFERIVKFISKNAYIVTAMTGESFLPAARHAVQLIMSNAMSVGAVSIISEYVMAMGKLIVTAAVVLSAYGILHRTQRADGFSNGLLVLITVGVIGYFIACVFINIFEVCIDTVLLSYCYDVQQNNGADRPFYCPGDLRKHVDKAAGALREKKKRGNDSVNDELNVPMKV